MKNFFTLIFVLSFVFSFSSYAQLVQENFDYPAGDTLTNHGWNITGTSTTSPITVALAGLNYVGYLSSGIGNAASLTTTGQDINKKYTDSVTSGSVYASFMVNITSAQTPGDYFIHLGVNPTNTFDFFGRVFVKLAANGNLAFGLSKSSTTTIPASYSDSVYTTGTTYLLVIKYTFNDGAANDTINLFINPDISGAEPSPNLTVATTQTDAASLGTVNLRQGNGSNAANVIVDGIRVSTSWFDVLNLIPISQAREDLNSDLIPDRLADTVTVKGIVISPNYQTSNRSYYINDGTGGLATFRSGLTSPALNLGDEVWVNGKIDHFNGLTEIVPLTDTSVVVLSDSNAIPAPTILTIAQYKADPEAYEGFLVAFGCLNKISGTWPSSSSATLKFSDGVDTIDIRIDSDTDIDNNTEPTYPKDIIGIGSQFTTYQILPRYYATDFLPCGTVPVELVSFSADVSDGNVLLSWTTATEKNNSGFDIEKSIDNSNFTKIGFVNGNGTTTENKVYSFLDTDLGKAKEYYYRLKQIDFNGSFSYSKVVQVSTNLISTFELKQNYPNPFNPSTQISFSLAQNGFVTLSVFNLIGQEVKILIKGNMEAGSHSITFDASGLPTGVYIYKLTSPGSTQTKKMMILK
jgi:Secretion system C-terminal sorting domain